MDNFVDNRITLLITLIANSVLAEACVASAYCSVCSAYAVNIVNIVNIVSVVCFLCLGIEKTRGQHTVCASPG